MRLSSPCERNLLIAKKKIDSLQHRGEEHVLCAAPWYMLCMRRSETTRTTTFHTKNREYTDLQSSASTHRPSQNQTHKMPESRRQKCANQLIIYVKLNKSSSRTEYPPKIIKCIQKQTNERANERTTEKLNKGTDWNSFCSLNHKFDTLCDTYILHIGISRKCTRSICLNIPKTHTRPAFHCD